MTQWRVHGWQVVGGPLCWVKLQMDQVARKGLGINIQYEWKYERRTVQFLNARLSLGMLCTGRPSFCPRILSGAERKNKPNYTSKRLRNTRASTRDFNERMDSHKPTVSSHDARRVHPVGWRLQSHSIHLERWKVRLYTVFRYTSRY